MGATPRASVVESPEKTKYELRVDPKRLAEAEKLQKRLSTLNVATALFTAVAMLNQLYDYQDQGYELAVHKDGKTIPFRLP
jgi:hypothetical protein